MSEETADWTSKCGRVRLWNRDCREVMPFVKADAVVTDPPYGINATEMTLGKGKKNFHRGDWDKQRPDVTPLLDIAPRVCIWGGNYFTDGLPRTNDWLVWHKKNDDRSFSECELAWTNYGLQTRHLSHHWGGEEKQHPTQKPLAVMMWAVGMAKAEAVFDPFMGSGTTGVAAIRLGRSFLGCEIDPNYFQIAVRRIQAELESTPLLDSIETPETQAEMFA